MRERPYLPKRRVMHEQRSITNHPTFRNSTGRLHAHLHAHGHAATCGGILLVLQLGPRSAGMADSAPPTRTIVGSISFLPAHPEAQKDRHLLRKASYRVLKQYISPSTRQRYGTATTPQVMPGLQAHAAALHPASQVGRLFRDPTTTGRLNQPIAAALHPKSIPSRAVVKW